MKTKKYPKLKIIGSYKSVNWQELYDFFKDSYNPLSLREFRGYVENMSIDNYQTRHWSADKDEKGFGELMALNAEKRWKHFNVKFYDSSDSDRYIDLEVDSINKRIILSCSLDNREKLVNVWEEIREIFNSFKIIQQEGLHPLRDRILRKTWLIVLILVIFFVFYKQLDWERMLDLKYWINKKLDLPFKGQENSQETSESLKNEISDKIEYSEQAIIKELYSLYARLKDEGDFRDGNIQ
jgi:hypothetical protein